MRTLFIQDFSMHKLFMILFSLCACISSNASDSVIKIPKKISDYLIYGRYMGPEVVYYWSNEMKPFTAHELFKETSPEGSYLAVGNADRSYINGALSRTNSIILVDSDPGIIAFNTINTLLIRIADDEDFYRVYRKNIELANSMMENEFTLEDTQLSKKTFLKACSLFWNYVHTKFEQKLEPLLSPVGKSRYCQGAHSPTISSLEYDHGFVTLLCPGGTEHPFEHANFLYDEELFKRVKKLAASAIIMQMDITNTKQLKQFQKTMTANNQRLSVIDISNIFPIDYVCTGEREDIHRNLRHDKNVRYYIQPEQFETFLTHINVLCHDKTMLVSTEWNENMEITMVTTTDNDILNLTHTDWDYKFASFKDIYAKQCATLKTAFPKGFEPSTSLNDLKEIVFV